MRRINYRETRGSGYITDVTIYKVVRPKNIYANSRCKTLTTQFTPFVTSRFIGAHVFGVHAEMLNILSSRSQCEAIFFRKCARNMEKHSIYSFVRHISEIVTGRVYICSKLSAVFTCKEEQKQVFICLIYSNFLVTVLFVIYSL